LNIPPSDEATPGPSQTPEDNKFGTSEDNVKPPSPEQRKTELGTPSQAPVATGPGDSPVLPKVQEDLLNDGIADQTSRRGYRGRILIAAMLVLLVFTSCLAGVVGTLSTGFYQALKPENIAKFVAIEFKGKVDKISSVSAEQPNTPKLDKPQATPSKEGKPTAAKAAEEHNAVKESEPVKIEARIYGEIRDSMVPLVALVSILTVAIVVILGTMLKAAFAPHPNNGADLKGKEATSSVPVLEALKSLLDSVKAAWK
jgi:hypothetical protein